VHFTAHRAGTLGTTATLSPLDAAKMEMQNPEGEAIHSAQLFLGSGDKLSEFNGIWIIVCQARREVVGNNVHGHQELTLLSSCINNLPGKNHGRTLSCIFHDDNIAFTSTGLTRYLRYGQHSPKHWPATQVWTVDFDQARIYLDRDDYHYVHDFPRSAHSDSLTIPRFRPCTPVDLPIWKPRVLLSWTPPDVIPQQLFDLVYRLVADYHANWRGRGYSANTADKLQKLGFGVFSCFTLNFKAELCDPSTFENYHECRQDRNQWRPSSYLGCNYLRWRTWPSPPVVPTINLEHAVIILSQNLDNAARLVQDHYMDVACDGSAQPELTYVVTSMSCVQLFKKTATTFATTPIIGFLQPAGSPSPRAVAWLLNAIHGHWYPLTTHLHKLPLELQELTLSHITPCDIERAKYAALLDIGIPFAWSVTHEREIVPLRLLNMQHPSRPRQISKTYPKQDITIWEDYLGLSYQPRLDGHKADEADEEVGSHSLG
jgi:hypothetical protein